MRTLNVDLGVASVVVRDDKILLVEEAKGPYSGKWGLPKGYVDDGELPVEAALRELSEECGLDGQVVGVVGVRESITQDHTSLFVVYRVEISDGDLVTCSNEIANAKFFSEDEISSLEWISGAMEILATNSLKNEYTLSARDLSEIRMRPYVVHISKEASSA